MKASCAALACGMFVCAGCTDRPVDPDKAAAPEVAATAVSAGWNQVVRADLDGSGHDELGFYTASNGTFSWYPVTATGALGARLSSATLGTGWDVIVGFDPDGDGVDQLAFYDAQSGNFAVYAATATGALGARLSAAVLGAGWTSIIAADFDGDGRDDLAFYNRTSGGYAVYHTNADGSLGARLSALTLSTGWSELVALDVNSDGRPELGFYNQTTGAFVVYPTTATGALGSKLSASVLSTQWSAVERVQIAGDRRPELALYDRDSGELAVYTLDTTGQLSSRLGIPAGFLTRQGKQLMLDGSVFEFVGVNAFGLTGCRTGTPDTQAVVDAFFASLRPRSITRTWAFKPLGLTGVQRVVASAESHNQKLVLALADGANFCNDTGHDAAFYAGGFRGAYFDWIRQIVPMFKDSPAIGIWEIMNEPGGTTDAVMRTFFDETAALIKSLDPNHLVGTGAQAEYVPGTTDYAFVHGGPNVDVGSLHEYDYGFENSRVIISGHLDPTLAAMNSINKPLYIGETGIELTDTCMTAQARASVLVQKFDGYLGRGAVGVLYWAWVSNPDTACGADVGTSDGPGSAVMTAIKNYVIH